MYRFSSAIAAALFLLAAPIAAPAIPQQQMIISVDPGGALVDADSGYRGTITWRVASAGGAISEKGVFVDLANNRVLETIEKPLRFSGDVSTIDEQLAVSASQVRRWYLQGVRQLGYRRSFSGAAGTLANRVVFDLAASGRLSRVTTTPAQQTLSGQSRRLMLTWNLDSDLGEVSVRSEGGQFLLGDRVVYEVVRPLVSESGSSVTESVELPPGLVQELLESGVSELRYNRIFVDENNTQRSASVALNLAW